MVFGAQWPAKPIRLTIRYAVGGGVDIFCRGFLHAMEEPLRASIESGNMPGSVGAIATDFVLKKPADGYSWLGAGNYNKFIDKTLLWDGLNITKTGVVCQEKKSTRYGSALLIGSIASSATGFGG